MEVFDRSVIEAASWRLASELVRRHPKEVRLIRGHPGGGQSDCLWLLPLSGERGDVRLNRVGTIQVLERFDSEHVAGWDPTEWKQYLLADPLAFLERLESKAGLSSPSKAPSTTPRTLTYRLLATIAVMAFKSVHRIEIQQGFIDTAGYGGGANQNLDVFRIPSASLSSQRDDFFGEPRYRFWIVVRDEVPVLAIEQDAAIAWTSNNSSSIDLMALFRKADRNLLTTTLEVLRGVEFRL